MKRKLLFLAGFLSLFLALTPVSILAVEADDVLGNWRYEEEPSTHITVYKCGEKYCGKIIGLKDPEQLDLKNEDESLKGRKLMGTDLFWNVEYDEDGEYEGGEIYASDRGEIYKCELELKSQNELEIKGCMGFICGGSDWRRIE